MKVEFYKAIGLIILLLMIPSIHAEGNCPSGYYPYNYTRDSYGNINGNQCAAIPGYNNQQQQSSMPPAGWASRWGAIAISYSAGHSGSAANQQSKRDANRVALQNCNVDGAADCKIALAYHDQCAALAWGGGFSAPASAATIKEASLLALHSCGTSECKVVYSECSLPERIQ